MKKIMILTVVVVLSVCVKAQVSVSGDCAYYTKNLSTFTGLMFGEEPALVTHMNVGLDIERFNVSAAYSGQHSIHHLEDGDRFNMLDLSIGYKLNNESSACVGYELTYSDNLEDDEFGHGVFAMAMFHKDRVSSTAIFFADPKIQNTYYIGSVDLQVMKSVSIYLLGGYTNTKSTRWNGLVGLKYSKGNLFVGTYYMLDKDNPGQLVSIGTTF